MAKVIRGFKKTQIMQYDLFNKVKTPPLEKASWSYSKIGTLKQCPRKYYFQYFGSKKRLALNEPNKERLIFLSTLSNKHLVGGSIVHTVIATYLKKKRKGEEWDLNRLINWSKKLLSESFIYSENLRNGIVDNRIYPPAILKEVYYSKRDLSGLRNEIENKIVTNLTNFIQSKKFEELKDGAIQVNSLIEAKAVFKIDESTQINGQIDIAFDSKEGIIIADWKTGKVEHEDTSLQLLAYALWAIEKKSIETNRIKIKKAYLFEDRLEELEFSEKHLFRARARILQDVELLRDLHEFGKEGISDAFTKCDQERVCTTCQFEEICHNLS
ncbi:MAG: PD-(D/E)XK nuclease family protein [Desulfovibrionales bacterium]|nr:PD-(D/E)XK nuclease family protein [Desulfovibrionales bacterium]